MSAEDESGRLAWDEWWSRIGSVRRVLLISSGGELLLSEGFTAGYEARRGEVEEERYVPGEWECPKCRFTLQKNYLHAQTGAVSTNNEEVREVCPNDGVTLRRQTWERLAEGLNRMLEEEIQARHDLTQADTTFWKKEAEEAKEQAKLFGESSSLVIKHLNAAEAQLAALEAQLAGNAALREAAGKIVSSRFNPWALAEAIDDLAALAADPARGGCPYGDATCPCQDGDPCHYEGENPMTPPARGVTLTEEEARVVLDRIQPSSTFLNTKESSILFSIRAKLRAAGMDSDD